AQAAADPRMAARPMTTSLVNPPSSWTPAKSTTPTAGREMPTPYRPPRAAQGAPAPAPPAPPGCGRDRDRTEEFDGHRRAQRQVLDRDIEDDVHGGEHGAEQAGRRQSPPGPRLSPPSPPRQQH